MTMADQEKPMDQPKPRKRVSLRKLVYGPNGRACPDCGCTDFRVTNKWVNADGTVRRLKKCRRCGRPVHSSEVEEE